MTNYKKVVYVSHPYGGKKENEAETAEIILGLYKKYPDYLFISPIHAFSFEYTFWDYEKGISRCLWLLDKCDEIWVFGDYKTSRGCQTEIEYASKLGISVKICEDPKNVCN